MTAAAAETPTQAYLRGIGDQAANRTRAAFDLAGKLRAYGSARAVLNGPALADWTERYEGDLRALVALAVDSLNDTFDSGTWQRIVRRHANAPTTTTGDDLVQQFRTAVAADYGAPAGEAAAVLTTLLAGTTIETAPSPGGVRITVRREGQQPAALELTAQRATGDRPRVSSTAFLDVRPPLAVQRRTRGEYGARAPQAVDPYGTVVDLFDALLGNARREVRTSRRYGRVRVQGHALAIALIIALAIAAIASLSYAIVCTGSVNPDNINNQNSEACQILGVISLVAWVLVLILGTGAAVKGSGPSSGSSYNLNPPSN